MSGRYYHIGYGPVTATAETKMDTPGLACHMEGPRPGAAPITKWCRDDQAALLMSPMAEVQWQDVLAALRTPAKPLKIGNSGLKPMDGTRLLAGTPEEVADFWHRLGVSSRCHLAMRWEDAAHAILVRLFTAPECPAKFRKQGLALLENRPKKQHQQHQQAA